MSRSALYTVNNTTQTVVADGNINLGTTIRRFGCNLKLCNNAINVNGDGYYKVCLNVTLAPITTGDVTVTLNKDGVAVPGANATATATAANQIVTLPITVIVRQNCCECMSNLTLTLSGVNASVTNVATATEKM